MFISSHCTLLGWSLEGRHTCGWYCYNFWRSIVSCRSLWATKDGKGALNSVLTSNISFTARFKQKLQSYWVLAPWCHKRSAVVFEAYSVSARITKVKEHKSYTYLNLRPRGRWTCATRKTTAENPSTPGKSRKKTKVRRPTEMLNGCIVSRRINWHRTYLEAHYRLCEVLWYLSAHLLAMQTRCDMSKSTLYIVTSRNGWSISI